LLVVLAACGSSARKTAPRPADVTTTTAAPATTTTVRKRVPPTTVAPTTTVPHIAAPTNAVTTHHSSYHPAPAPLPRPPVATPTRTVTSGPPEGGAAGQIVAGINAFRASHGLGALAVNSNLVSKANSWAAHMAGGGCGSSGGVPNICHSSLASGISVSWTLLEENVGMISPASNVSGMESAFEHSAAHAENMLNGKITYVGVGVAYVGNYMYVAEEFMAT
jgi:uncharacterized protein YkwD